MSWYTSGYQAIAMEEDRQNSNILPNSFWVAAGGDKSMVLIGDEPLCIYEHQIKTPEFQFGTSLTCSSKVDPENALCCQELGSKNAFLVGYTTVIDCSDKKDPAYAFELQLFPAKLKTLTKLRNKKKAKGSLVNIKWNMSRTDKKSPRVGDDMEYVEDIKNMGELFKVVTYRGKKLSDLFNAANKAGNAAIDKIRATFQVSLDSAGKILPIIPEFNYQEILKPKDPNLVKLLLKSRIKEDSFGGGSVKVSGTPGFIDDTIPF